MAEDRQPDGSMFRMQRLRELRKNKEESENDVDLHESPAVALTSGQRVRKEVFSWLRVFVFAIAAAFFINNVVIVNAHVPSGSMRNTIVDPARLVAFRLSYLFSEPQRLDVIVFRFPENPDELHVKRIIALPGERIDIVYGQVYINQSQTPLDEWYLMETPIGFGIQTFYVPDDSFFVMGDNRNDSHDSRSWLNTFLPRDNILGQAIFTYFPTINIIR